MRKSRGIDSANPQIAEELADDSPKRSVDKTIRSILVVDPDSDFSCTVSDYLKLFGCNICFRTDIDDALSYAKTHGSDVIFLSDNFDYQHPIDVLRRFKSILPSALIVILANKGDDQLAVELLKSGADDYLSRRVKDKDILTSIAGLLEKLTYNGLLIADWRKKPLQKNSSAVVTPRESAIATVIDSLAEKTHHPYEPKIEQLPGVLFFLNRHFEILEVNQKCLDLFGYEACDLLNQAIDKFIPKQIYSDLVYEVNQYKLNADIDAAKESNYSPLFEMVIITEEGNGIPVKCQVRHAKLKNRDNRVETGYLLSIEDLSNEKAKQADLQYQSMWSNLLQAFAYRFINLKLERFSDELTAVVSETANFFRLDRVSIYLFDKNGAKAKIYLEWLKKDVDSLKLFSKKIELDQSLAEITKLIAGEVQLLEPVKNIKDPSMDQYCGLSEHYAQVNASTSVLLPIIRNDKVIGWIALDHQSDETSWQVKDLPMIAPLGQLFSEAFARRAKEEQRKVTHQKLSENHGRLSEQAFLDGLTKLANRRYFDKVLESEVRRASRDKSNIALLFCDVDYFKAYNDTYGHLEGDTCLKSIAEVLQQEFQRAGDFVARYGGEEFAVILSGTLAKDAQEAAEKLDNILSQ